MLPTLRPRTRDRLDHFWADLFGTVPADRETQIVEHGPRLARYPGIYAIRRAGRSFVSVPPALTEVVREWAPGLDAVVDPSWWAERLPDWRLIGPSEHSFLDQHSHLPDSAGARPASQDEVRAALLSRVRAEDWSESGFGADVAAAWLLEDGDGRPVAAANLTLFDDVPADVGVLVATDARGRGHATRVSAAATRFAVETHGLARWRTRTANLPSRAAAARLGFEPDCTQLAARPA